MHVNKSLREKGGGAEWTSSRLKASEECSIEREAGSASSGETEDEEQEEVAVVVGDGSWVGGGRTSS